MVGTPKCVICAHVQRSHQERKCADHCPGFVAAVGCPLKIEAHNTSKGHVCDCVPGQLALI